MVEKPKVTDATRRKAQLIADLEWSRNELAASVRAARSDLDLVARFKHSVAHRKTAWLSGAAVAGWILSRLPGRKKVSPPKASAKASPNKLSQAERTGFLLALLGGLFKLVQPALTALISRKVTDFARGGSFGWRKLSR